MTEYFIRDIISNFEATEFVESRINLDTTDREEVKLLEEEEVMKYGLKYRKTRQKIN